MQSGGTTLQQPLISESAAEIVGYNEDVLSQILSRLPVKSLGKFRCVSKNWNSLISHLRPRVYSPCGLLVRSVKLDEHEDGYKYEYVSLDTHNHRNEEAPFSNLTFVHDRLSIDVVRSTNGLLLLRSTNYNEGYYYVYSPITKQYRKCPPVDEDSSFFDPFLVYDPLISPSYKIVGIRKCYLTGKSEYKAVIYSSQTGSWRVSNTLITTLIRGLTMCQFQDPVPLNGAVYFITCCRGYCFDVGKEQVKEFIVPGDSGHIYFDKYFGESRGRLYGVVSADPRTDATGRVLFDVYEMGIDCTQWSLKYKIEGDLYSIFCVRVMFVVREENEDDSFAVLDVYDIIYSYNFKNKKFTELSEFSFPEDGKSCFNLCRAHLYTEVPAFPQDLTKVLPFD
ncbi:hypothetical protein Tsubulata_019022 [Turnera subulata]|uniref:F-box domain-containing protein n=1 Tax=Turnera subulata TaxID=218843 RepID=A0A9Q0JGA4_9ROSI|nr:hypothetical protein Tsubulata_019022 [Turnera subulata]